MLATSTLSLFAIASAAVAAAAPPQKPWEISDLIFSTPSGRPQASPYSHLNFTVIDPNVPYYPPPAGSSPSTDVESPTDKPAPPTTVQCYAEWVWLGKPEAFYGLPNNCSHVEHGRWIFTITKPNQTDTTDMHDFNLRLTHLVHPGEGFVGEAQFSWSKNLRGLCAASGFCQFVIRADALPFYINQTFTRVGVS
ncbi:hypothetical protein B0T22DRAFT_532436 [Podospora appendiculata]|uniref:Ubiquitin 3 binding protein But2 C-terminal domain-containing protein n=1 Tax=Podospora appendiculata TaxID=314037 RepID=A0AAE1CG93_9PEZI|nr:hypothetical protein B0T22DRAFT_532436 [Podospora appendiculata]